MGNLGDELLDFSGFDVDAELVECQEELLARSPALLNSPGGRLLELLDFSVAAY